MCVADWWWWWSAGKDKDHEWLLTEKDKFDNEHDTDKDGILDRNEILAWVVPTNEYEVQQWLFTNPRAMLLISVLLSTY